MAAEAVAVIALPSERVAEEGATTIVLGDSASICVSALVRRDVRHRGLRSVDLSGDAIALPRRRQRRRLPSNAALSLSQSEYTMRLWLIAFIVAVIQCHFFSQFPLPTSQNNF